MLTAALIALVCATGFVFGPMACSSDSRRPRQPPPEQPVPEPAPERMPLDRDAVLERTQAVLDALLVDAEPEVRRNACRELRDVDADGLGNALMNRVETDPAADVRACAAVALAMLQVSASRAIIEAGYPHAQRPQKVWYAYALHLLGMQEARAWLHEHAQAQELDVAVRAALWLADVSERGAPEVIVLLQRMLDTRYAELADIAPPTPLMVLARLARLGVAEARERLYELLDDERDAIRLAAAEALVDIGDGAGAETLRTIFDQGDADARLRAAYLLARLGEYHGADILADVLRDGDRGQRRLVARTYAQFGDTDSLRLLVGLLDSDTERDPLVRAAAAAGALLIVSADPILLADASIDWARRGIESEDWSARAAVAETLAELPPDRVIPVLITAIGDSDKRVRTASVKSAARMSGSLPAAMVVADRLKDEPDPEVQAECVVAIARIGRPEVKGTLKRVATERSRVGILAIGALVSLGDGQLTERLQRAYRSARAKLRLAVMEAGMLIENAALIPTLKRGLADSVLAIRFQAAEALARLAGLGHDSRASADAIENLRAGMAERPDWMARALRGLAALGSAPGGDMSLETLARSPDPQVRAATLPALAIRPLDESHWPLWQLLAADEDANVRAAVVAALAERDPDEAHLDRTRHLLKGFTRDPHDVTRNRARAQLAQLPATVAFDRNPTPPNGLDSQPPPPDSQTDNQIASLAALDALNSKIASFDDQHKQIADVLATIDEHVARPVEDDDDIEQARQLIADANAALAILDERDDQLLHSQKSALVVAHADSARVNDALLRANERVAAAPGVIRELRARVAQARRDVEAYEQEATAGCEFYLSGAENALGKENYSLRKARKELKGARKTCTGPRDKIWLTCVTARYREVKAKETGSDEERSSYLDKALQGYRKCRRTTSSARQREFAAERIRALAAEM